MRWNFSMQNRTILIQCDRALKLWLLSTLLMLIGPACWELWVVRPYSQQSKVQRTSTSLCESGMICASKPFVLLCPLVQSVFTPKRKAGWRLTCVACVPRKGDFSMLHTALDLTKLGPNTNKSVTNAPPLSTKQYFEQKEADLASEIGGSHRWSQKAKALAKISSPKDFIPELAFPDSGERASSDTKKANLLADFFAKQCTDRPARDSGSVNAALGAPYPLPDGAATFTFPPTTESVVLRKLLPLRPSKATADSFFCNRFLQKCSPFLARSITFLFNLSLSTSSFPSAWKHAKVIPLYKHRGSQSDPSNYRPISLLPAIGKVMDDILSSRLLDFMTSNKLISMH